MRPSDELKKYDECLKVNFFGKAYPLYKLIESLIVVTDKLGQTRRFVLNEAQVELYKKMCEQKPIRLNILKGRQLGCTTFIAACFTIYTLFNENIRCGVCADTLDHAQDIFSKYQYFYDHLDDFNPNKELIESNPKEYGYLSYKPKLKYAKGKKLLETEKTNSIIEVFAVGDNAGRSKTYQLLHCSEVAFWNNVQGTFTSLLQTVYFGNPNSMIFIETTGNGFNEYKKRWDGDVKEKQGRWKPVFLPWYLSKEYEDDSPLSENLEEWEVDLYKNLFRNFGKDEARKKINFYHKQYLDLNRDKAKLLQEYPSTPSEAFVSTGNCYFDQMKIAARKDEVITNSFKQGAFNYDFQYSPEGEVRISSYVFEEIGNGPLKIYEEPISTHPYVVVSDPSEGGSDYTAIVVFDNHTGKQVAVVNSRELGNDVVAHYCYMLGKMYNEAMIAIENNRGKLELDTLIKTNYRNIYISTTQSYDSINKRVQTRYGYNTNVGNRNFMLQTFKVMFESDPSIIADFETLSEMESFEIVEHYDKTGKLKRSKPEANGGAHDDLVMACAGFFLVRGSRQTTTLLIPEKNKKEKLQTSYVKKGFQPLWQ